MLNYKEENEKIQIINSYEERIRFLKGCMHEDHAVIMKLIWTRGVLFSLFLVSLFTILVLIYK